MTLLHSVVFQHEGFVLNFVDDGKQNFVLRDALSQIDVAGQLVETTLRPNFELLLHRAELNGLQKLIHLLSKENVSFLIRRARDSIMASLRLFYCSCSLLLFIARGRLLFKVLFVNF